MPIDEEAPLLSRDSATRREPANAKVRALGCALLATAVFATATRVRFTTRARATTTTDALRAGPDNATADAVCVASGGKCGGGICSQHVGGQTVTTPFARALDYYYYDDTPATTIGFVNDCDADTDDGALDVHIEITSVRAASVRARGRCCQCGEGFRPAVGRPCARAATELARLWRNPPPPPSRRATTTPARLRSIERHGRSGHGVHACARAVADCACS